MGHLKYSAIPSRNGSSLNDLIESPPYRLLVESIRQDDMARAGAMIAEQIANTNGDERFFWFNLQVSARLRLATTPLQKLNYLSTVLALAVESGDDPEKQRAALDHAFVVLLGAERISELAHLCLRLRRGYELYRRDRWVHQYNRALLHTLNGRWERAHLTFADSLTAFAQLPEARRSAMRGYQVALYAERSICAIRLGGFAWAEADLQKAIATQEGSSARLWLTYLAEAEIALGLEVCDRARSLLQTALTRLSRELPGSPRGQIRLDLLAARIARAEGNTASFHHFAERALGTAQEHQLRLSEKEVRRVLEGAPH